MITSTDQQNVIVIGAGMAGLATGAYLARAGLRVTILEQAAHLGGRARSRNRDGFIFNEGAHALYTGGPATRVMDELGVSYAGGSPAGAFVLEHGRFEPLPASLSMLLRSHSLGWRDKLALARFFQILPAIDPSSISHLTIEAWLTRSIRRPRVRRLLAALARTTSYSDAIDITSAQVFVDRIQLSLKHPVRYIDGGWQTLVDGMRKAAERAGARIESGVRVGAVEHGSTGVSGVRLEGGKVLPATAVVLACGPRAASQLVDGGDNAGFREIVDAMLPAEVACLDLALRRLPSDRYTAVQDLDGPRFLSMQSICARVAPAGGAMVQAFKQLYPGRRSDPRQDEIELEHLLDQAQSGWRDCVVDRVFLPRMEASSLLPTARSGGYSGRPGQRLPGIARLYVAGDWVGPEGYLLDAALASAETGAGMVLDDLQSLLSGDEARASISRQSPASILVQAKAEPEPALGGRQH